MVDLHCHILPCIDDGPKNAAQSAALIKMELDNGVDTIAVTPHFIKSRQPGVADFCKKRRQSLNILNEALKKENLKINIIEAAEVALCIDLPETDGLEQLKYANTDYMLVELPNGYYYDWIPQTLYNLRLSGITPVLAHIERYSYLMKEPKILYELVNSGCVAQINASFLLRADHFKFSKIRRLAENQLVHLIVTDAHSVEHRPPELKAAMDKIQNKWGDGARNYFCKNAEGIIVNRQLGLQPIMKEKVGFLAKTV